MKPLQQNQKETGAEGTGAEPEGLAWGEGEEPSHHLSSPVHLHLLEQRLP